MSFDDYQAYGNPGRALQKMEARFWEFHSLNPRIYALLERFALAWLVRHPGGKTLGIGMLYERVRWECAVVETEQKATVRLNNNHRAFYARLLMKKTPGLAGLFRMRVQNYTATFEGKPMRKRRKP